MVTLIILNHFPRRNRVDLTGDESSASGQPSHLQQTHDHSGVGDEADFEFRPQTGDFTWPVPDADGRSCMNDTACATPRAIAALPSPSKSIELSSQGCQAVAATQYKLVCIEILLSWFVLVENLKQDPAICSGSGLGSRYDRSRIGGACQPARSMINLRTFHPGLKIHSPSSSSPMLYKQSHEATAW